MGRGVAYAGFRWDNVREIYHLGYPELDWMIILIWIFK